MQHVQAGVLHLWPNLPLQTQACPRYDDDGGGGGGHHKTTQPAHWKERLSVQLEDARLTPCGTKTGHDLWSLIGNV
eukprot:1151572-Pelagomonas_calceolata.AAC.5